MERKCGSPAFTLSRRVGSTNYQVNAYYPKETAESVEDKIIRIIENEAGTNGQECGIMKSPHMSRPA